MASGTFYGVGVGPGDPELLTRKAVRILESVDWIYHPVSARTGTSIARGIVAPLQLAEEKFRPVPLRMSRERAADLAVYHRAAEELLAELRQGRSVAWITEGDPLFYSTFLYVYEEVRRHPEIPVQVVPGVTSLQAAAARAGVPLAQLGERLAVLPALAGVEALPELLEQFATVCLLKVSSMLEPLLDRLGALPFPVQTFYLERLGMPGERVTSDLASLRGQELPYFSLVLVRRVGNEAAGEEAW
jgi:precorrin-2/cobalt-factor-2 C20-methyltransferase